jgi:uncharacterized membrane protein YphA (DoxX/SURF4 family)
MEKICGKCNLPPRDFFLFGARMAIGIWLFYVGFMKWYGGAAGFVGYISSQFAATWSPPLLNTALGWLIVCAEPLIGLWLLSGRCKRCAWTAASLLMFLLMFGMTMLQKPEVIYNFHYFVFCLVCAAWTPSSCSESEEK